MEIKIITIIFLIVCTIFFILRKEIIYSVVSVIMLLVSFSTTITFDRLITKSPPTILLLDYSQSSIQKTKNVEKSIPLQEFDYIKKFGIPYNKKDELKTILNPDQIIFIVSDFLFEIPEEITKNSNIILVYIEDKTKTNHSIKSIYTTNISQIEYLTIETLFPSEITITDPKTKKQYFKGKNLTNYLIPTTTLPEKILISSLNTNITISIPKIPQIGVIWYELNQDLRIFLSILKEFGYTYELIPKIREKIILPEKKYKNLLLGYPDETIDINKLLEITEEKSKIVIVSPSESFLRNLISFSQIKNLNLKPEDFIYIDEAKLFNLNFKYPVKLKEAYKYNFPKINGKILPLDKNNTTFYLKFSDREMVIILFKELYSIDIENLKLGIYSSFSKEIFTELTKFFEISEDTKIINLQESAIDGGIKPKGNTIHYKEISEKLLKEIKNRHKLSAIEQQKINLSNIWLIMVFILALLSVKWLIRK